MDKFNLKSWLIGFALGLSGEPLPIGIRPPVAYLYNGFRLPALPEWDKETYPYAIMIISSYSDGSISAYLACFSKPEHFWQLDDYLVAIYLDVGETFISSNYFSSSATSFEFGELTEKTATEVVSSRRITFEIDWANYDVLNEDSTLYLAASNPIPVYE